MMAGERYVSASEIGSYVFCRRAWHLDRCGVPTTLEPERAAGVAFHERHGRQVRIASQARGLAPWFAIAALVLIVLALLLAVR
nr:hypothetical protein [uncultured Rhodopila sp.]